MKRRVKIRILDELGLLFGGQLYFKGAELDVSESKELYTLESDNRLEILRPEQEELIL